MFAFIRGKLVEATPSFVVIDTGSIGYTLHVAPNLLHKLPGIGNEVFLYTLLIIRENSQALYGFISSEERKFFEMLTAISGIGPKLGLSLIGHLSIKELTCAIQSQDVTAICKVPGIGKKIAARILVELKDTLCGATACGEDASQMARDAMQALVHLGYKQQVAEKAVATSLKESPDPDLGKLITLALQKI